LTGKYKLFGFLYFYLGLLGFHKNPGSQNLGVNKEVFKGNIGLEYLRRNSWKKNSIEK